MNNFQNVFNLIYRLSFIKPHSLSPVWRHLRLSAWTIEIVVNFTTISMAWTRWRSRFVHVIIQPIRRLETKESTRSFSAENEFNDFRRKIINISKWRPDTRQNGIQHNVRVIATISMTTLKVSVIILNGIMLSVAKKPLCWVSFGKMSWRLKKILGRKEHSLLRKVLASKINLQSWVGGWQLVLC